MPRYDVNFSQGGYPIFRIFRIVPPKQPSPLTPTLLHKMASATGVYKKDVSDALELLRKAITRVYRDAGDVDAVAHAEAKIGQILMKTLRRFNYRPSSFPKVAQVLRFKAIRVRKLDEVCVICQEKTSFETSVRILDCGHFFHHACVQEWLKRSPTCPTCRQSVP
ncbi:putative ubiquitin ligase [Feldmannia species virus]|uniref:RING-type E3 ubiquitin transferase n=1 Tax=Feldmannia species virus TaxID=39420 RepID=B5LW90_9PHYC|nr:putative ubiquitin ligase [Feldmannia species virus]ACH46753.1 putative ubiquitin ligase [Feldmannia species virus]